MKHGTFYTCYKLFTNSRSISILKLIHRVWHLARLVQERFSNDDKTRSIEMRRRKRIEAIAIPRIEIFPRERSIWWADFRVRLWGWNERPTAMHAMVSDRTVIDNRSRLTFCDVNCYDFETPLSALPRSILSWSLIQSKSMSRTRDPNRG